MTIAVLTSSRADYGIYRPLLQALKDDAFFQTIIIAFGTHLSHNHGYTFSDIEKDGFEVEYALQNQLEGENPEDITNCIGKTTTQFAILWKKLKEKSDLIICLGDRYEMFAAVQASIPFQIPVAHIHGGETTLGAIDNIFRHCLSLMSKYHFSATEIYSKKIQEMIGSTENIYTVGALGLDNIKKIQLLSIEDFLKTYQIDMIKPTILLTFHPETVNFEKNKAFAQEICQVIEETKHKYQYVITMPNADTMGNTIRNIFTEYAQNKSEIKLIENFGTKGYFSCINLCSFLLGNTSSGIIEAASFKKYVINIGDRQKGRLCSENTFQANINKLEILEAIKNIETLPEYKGSNIYGDGATTQKIINLLKSIK